MPYIEGVPDSSERWARNPETGKGKYVENMTFDEWKKQYGQQTSYGHKSDSSRKANKKWDEKNKERKSYINKRSTAKSFILNLATQENLETIKKYVEQRKNELNK